MYHIEIEDSEGNIVHLHAHNSVGAINTYETVRFWSDVARIVVHSEDGPQLAWKREVQ